MPATDPPAGVAAATPDLLAHAFRHDYGRVVATLCRRFGYHRSELIEDVVQDAFLSALRVWPAKGMPTQPAAWIFQVARNRLIDELRQRKQVPVSLEGMADDGEALHPDASPTGPDAHFSAEIADDELRMMFVCADETIPIESQLVLVLKVLGGFSTREIALRLLTSEENVQKRLSRGRERLRQHGGFTETPPLQALLTRRDSVMRAVYLIFNEGYSSMLADRPIRIELCTEAIRLGHLLAEHPVCGCAAGDALLALMYLHAARFDARLDGNGGLLLLEEQDRRLWDQDMIRCGLEWLRRSGRGDEFSRYHAEAAVAMEHCLAPSYAHTNWRAIVENYELLERFEPSPLHALNRAIALAEWKGPAAGLAVLHAIKPPSWLAGYYLWDAALGELERRAGNHERARHHLARAIEAAPLPAEKQLLRRRLAACPPASPDAQG